MTPEPSQSRGTDPRVVEACPEATPPESPQARDGQPNPLLDALPEAWALPSAMDLPRRVGVRATRAALRAKARRLESQGDFAAAADAYREVAHTCWADGVDYGEAIRSAKRVVELRPDDPMRGELADRLERLGEQRACAELLEGAPRGIALEQAPAIGRRLASLSCRVGDAQTAAAHFAELARIEPEATDALTAIGTMAGWAPEQVSRGRGVMAWHEAARRFKNQGSLLSAFEATHRAFELDPASSLAAERLANELEVLGRREAADEVWRQSAVASGDSARHDVRAVAMLDIGDSIGALAAMLDGRADASFDMSQLLSGVEHLLSPHQGVSRGFDMVLAELGCADWLAVRLEAGPLLERWTDEADCHAALGRLEVGHFAHLDAAREALVRAIVVHPAQPEARARLSSGTTKESAPDALLRALVQSARAAPGGLVVRQLASELVERGRNEPYAASLRVWAFERLQLTGHLSDELRAEQPMWSERAAQQQAELTRLQSAWSTVSAEERVAMLRTLESRLALDPNRAIDHLAVVVALVEIDPTDRVAQSMYVELLDIAAHLVISPTRDERLSAAVAQAPDLLGERGRIAQAKFHLRHGQIQSALSALLPLLEEEAPSVRGLLWLYTLARRFRDALASARALERVSSAFQPAIRGVLEALAADLYLEARAPEDAWRMVSTAVRTSQNMPRLVTLEIQLDEYSDPLTGSESIERALSKVLPNAPLCLMLAGSHQRIGEPDVALAWTQRALSLRPGDLGLRNRQLQLALEVGDASRVVDILNELMNQALPISAWVEVAASALAWLTSVDASRTIETAKRLLDFVGGSERSLRAAFLDAAYVNGDEAFAIEVLERAAAIAPDSPLIEIALAERRWKRNDVEAGMLAALRAARAGAHPDGWMGYVWVSTEGVSADAELMRLELSRLLLLQDERTSELQQALRQLALARFDMAQDTEGAIEIWRELAEMGDIGDWGRVARDMGEVLGKRTAAARLADSSRTIVGGAERAKVLGLAAQLSYEAGDGEDAVRLLERAFHAAPEGSCMLPFVEGVINRHGEPERLESFYALVEQSVLGIYGERSLHYRAARAFENVGEWTLALRHAIRAFEILPNGEAAWKALVRISRAAEQPQALALAAMRVAQAAGDPSSSCRWLARAFQLLADTPDDLRLKFELGIRMLEGAPEVRGVYRVASCIALMQRAGVEDLDLMRARFERALESLIGELEGPDGARLGIAVSEVAATELARFDISAQALFAALKADADLEEFAGLVPALAPRVSTGRDVFLPMLHRTLDWLEGPYVQAGQDALGLLTHIAVATSDGPALTRIEQCASRTGRQAWLRQWLNDELLSSLFDGKDGRAGVIVLAAAWTEAGFADFALMLLDRAAQLFASQYSDPVEQHVLDATWHAFREQYATSMARLSLPDELSASRQRLLGLESLVPSAIVAFLRVALERRSADPRALCSALAELAFVGLETPQVRAELLIEAAGIAEQLGDLDGAFVYYSAAASTQRASVAARMGLGILMVRMRRHRTKEQAQLLLDMALDLESSVAEEQRDVAVFLQAEALDGLGMESDAHRLLQDAEARIGPRPLIVLGLAEHAILQQEPALALGYFAAALGGNLRQLRSRSVVSMAAARAAAAVGDVSMALRWLEPGLADPTTRPDALVLQAELQGAADIVEVDATRPVPYVGETSEALVARPPSGETVLHEIPLAVKKDVFVGTDATIAQIQSGIASEPTVCLVEPSELALAVAAAERAAREPEQLRAWFADGKRWLRQWPLSTRLAELVQGAARLESHASHATALEHFVGVLRGDLQVTQPSELGERIVDIDAVRSLLLRELTTPESEALALVWDGAEHEFLREASDYDVTGVMRVVGTASPLARIYSEVARHFGIAKTPLFFKRSAQLLATRVLLLNPIAVLLEGELGTDEHLMGYRVGCALWATVSEHSLLFGLERDRISAVLRALVLAFGSTEGQPNPTLGESLRLAQVLWQTVTSRSQRRLKEICVAELDIQRAWVASNQSLRRAGLYVCGDLRTALSATAADIGLDPALVHGSHWTDACRLAPELLDLFRFAASAEYADVRWQSGRPAQLGGAGGRTP